MKKLKAEYREVLWLMYFEDRPAREIAEIMKKSKGSIEKLASRARQALKRELEKEKITS